MRTLNFLEAAEVVSKSGLPTLLNTKQIVCHLTAMLVKLIQLGTV